MKQATRLTAAVLGLSATVALAQMGSGQGGMMGGQGAAGAPRHGMGTQQSQQMMGGQMMSQEMMRDMSGMMRQMDGMMQNMSHMMEQQPMMDQAHRQEMSKLMQEMSTTMRDMSKQMGQGKMDPATTKQMQDRIQRMDQMLRKLQADKR